MATNPMQRRARNSFLIGFLIALVIMAVVVIGLLYKIQGLNEDYEAIKKLQTKVYVANDFIQSGEEVTLESFTLSTVQTTLDKGELIASEDFEYIDDETGEIVERYDSQTGALKKKKMVVKTNIPAGSIITKDMLEEIDDPTTADQRLEEYNMIILPTLLKNGDYIDVRLQLPGGENYIVVSKKKVIHSTQDTVWLKMKEEEILTLGNAIVEAWGIVGSKLYATPYTEPGRQNAAIPTYPVSLATMTLINNDPNVIEEAKQAIWNRYNDQEQVVQRNDHINSALSENYNNLKQAVETGLQEELSKRQEGRLQYVETLEGTDMTGTE